MSCNQQHGKHAGRRMLVLEPRPAAGSGDAAALAATAYRGLLLALPASTALWFGDLRDRGTAAAVESYTREQHSPVLLAHELAIIQVWDQLCSSKAL